MTSPYRIRRKARGFHPDHFNPGWGEGAFHPPSDGGARSGGGGGKLPHVDVPATLPDLALWLRSDLGITLVGSKVSAWADQGPNKRDLSQGTDANRPSYVANVVAGKPAVRFTAASSQTMGFTAWTHPSPAATAFAVIRMQSAPSVIQALMLQDALSPRLYASIGATGRAGLHWDSAFRADTGIALDTNVHLLRYQYSAAETRAAQDNNADGTGTAGTTYGNWAFVGSRAGPASDQFLDADVFEIVVYGRTLAAAEIDIFEAYSRSRYGVP